ncbi:alanine--tRNA ligase [candidate division KSB1 bacterium]|nr:MAG: alanine--tRNA ligase [candidate division KSB1 bacterium]RKY88075.1 MAG: alanine--tRNA ligase [candidate division KSB1 bacterium]
MKSNEIRNSFLDFFRSKGHKIVPSASVVPFDDPSLLFTNAGMNQFKNIFLGVEKPQFPRVANCQKCIRVSGKHNDLEEVGKDTYHHTFFEMLGNWSFGDYYKREAIEFAWELLTEVWKLPKERLWATVFYQDIEAEKLWKEITDINPKQVLRFDEEDNFWEMGEVGPCGPCSEIHIDLGEDFCDMKQVPGHVCQVNGGCSRFIELWNLVFIQFNRTEDGSFKELPARHVDTGMGFERIVAVLQGVKSNYDTDLFRPLFDAISEISGVEYSGTDEAVAVAHRVIADHVRALSFAIADGALPSNEGRGYVLRRILRRAARYGRTLGMHEPFIYKLVPVLADVMGATYPELLEKHQYIATVIKSEEEGFSNTLDRGIELFENVAAKLIARKERVFPGNEVFRLYDTYGFPVDLTRLMAEERGLEVDLEGFEKAMSEQRRRAQQAQQFQFEVRDFFGDAEEIPNSRFVGYDTLETEVRIVSFKGNEFLLDQTPFYGEAGGQVGDTGVIFSPDHSFEVKVVNTIRAGTRIVHIGEVQSGRFEDVLQKPLVARVDAERRKAIARNHTCTHLLHKALREVLGKHVNQAGSLVAPDRLRFDFTHFEKISESQLDEVERRVNEIIRANFAVEVLHKTFDEAKLMGATALFGEKYADVVRVVKIDDYSLELCGGTHLDFTGEIGYFRITTESSVAAGIRRIEAVTGEAADKILRQEKRELAKLRQMLNVSSGELLEKVKTLLEDNKRLLKTVSELNLKIVRYQINEVVNQAHTFDGVKIIATQVSSHNVEELKQIGDILRTKLGSGVGVLGSVINQKAFLLCVVTDDLIKQKNIKAGEIVSRLARIIGGGGGGHAHMAQAGGKDVGKLDLALAKTKDVVAEMIAN